MKNTKYQKTIVFIILGILIYPSVTFASWWNPFSWFQKKTTVPETVQAKKIETTVPIPNDSEKKIKPTISLKVIPQKQVPTTSKKMEEVKKSTPTVPVQQPKKDIVNQADIILLQSLQSKLTQFPSGISMVRDSYETKAELATRGINLCGTAYTNALARLKSDFEYMKNYTRTNGSGGVMNMGALDNLNKIYEQDLDTIAEDKERCLLKYRSPDSSIENKLNQISDRVSELRSLVNTPQDALRYQSEISSLESSLLSLASRVGSY